MKSRIYNIKQQDPVQAQSLSLDISFLNLSAHSTASRLPCSTLTRPKTGIGTSNIASKNKNPYLILPVKSDMSPTVAGPMKDADLSVKEKREKKVDS